MPVFRCEQCGDVHCGLPIPSKLAPGSTVDEPCGTWPVEDWPGPLPERYECEQCDECGKPHVFTAADVDEVEQEGCRFIFRFHCPDTEYPEGPADIVAWYYRNYFVDESTGEQIFPGWTVAKEQPADREPSVPRPRLVKAEAAR